MYVNNNNNTCIYTHNNFPTNHKCTVLQTLTNLVFVLLFEFRCSFVCLLERGVGSEVGTKSLHRVLNEVIQLHRYGLTLAEDIALREGGERGGGEGGRCDCKFDQSQREFTHLKEDQESLHSLLATASVKVLSARVKQRADESYPEVVVIGIQWGGRACETEKQHLLKHSDSIGTQ